MTTGHLRLWSWIKEVWLWLSEGKHVFAYIVISIVILGCALYLHTERSFRISGFVFQLFGMILAIRGLLKIRLSIEQTTLKENFFKWIHRFPKWKREPITASINAVASRATVGFNIDAFQPDNLGDTLENRIKALARNQEIQRNEITKLREKIQDLEKEIESLEGQMKMKIKETEESINSTLKTIHTDDFLPALIGLVWITIGITLSTLSPELHFLIITILEYVHMGANK